MTRKLVATVQRMLDRAFPNAQWDVSERTCGGTLGLTRADAIDMILVEDVMTITKMFPDFIAYVTLQADKTRIDGFAVAVWLTPRSTVKARKARISDKVRISDKALARTRGGLKR